MYLTELKSSAILIIIKESKQDLIAYILRVRVIAYMQNINKKRLMARGVGVALFTSFRFTVFSVN